MLKNRRTRSCRGLVCLALVGGSLAGCSTPKPFGGAPSLQTVNSGVLPAPTRQDFVASDQPAFIGPSDELTLSVFGIEGLEKIDVQVDGGGNITFPLIGVVEVSGRTIAEIQQEVRSRLQAKYVRDPQVTVNLKKAADRVVTVEGQVSKSGSYPILGRTTLLKAVANAGSPAEFARLHEVVVFREVAGQRYAALYNLAAIRRGAYADPELFANDLVVVDESRARRLFKDLIQIVPLLTAPLVIALQNGSGSK